LAAANLKVVPEQDDDRPERQSAIQGDRKQVGVRETDPVQRQKRRENEELVGDRIDDLTEVRDLPATTGQLTVPEVRDPREHEDKEGQQS
jgi:hypothetical protein